MAFFCLGEKEYGDHVGVPLRKSEDIALSLHTLLAIPPYKGLLAAGNGCYGKKGIFSPWLMELVIPPCIPC